MKGIVSIPKAASIPANGREMAPQIKVSTFRCASLDAFPERSNPLSGSARLAVTCLFSMSIRSSC
jgi:hypothetical protein